MFYRKNLFNIDSGLSINLIEKYGFCSARSSLTECIVLTLHKKIEINLLTSIKNDEHLQIDNKSNEARN